MKGSWKKKKKKIPKGNFMVITCTESIIYTVGCHNSFMSVLYSLHWFCVVFVPQETLILREPWSCPGVPSAGSPKLDWLWKCHVF